MFTVDWTVNLQQSLNKIYKQKRINCNVTMMCLEVGAFQGKGSLIIADRVCNSPNSRLYCVDPWDDVYLKDKEVLKDHDKYYLNQYNIFTNNTSKNKKIIPCRGMSNDLIPKMNQIYDFIYVDGDHTPEQVYLDAVNCFRVLKVGGTMLFDDYKWEQDGIKTGDGIDKFLDEYKSYLQVLFIDYQAAIKKTSNTSS